MPKRSEPIARGEWYYYTDAQESYKGSPFYSAAPQSLRDKRNVRRERDNKPLLEIIHAKQ